MSRHRMTVILEIDDEAFEKHDGGSFAPPNDIDEWDPTDIDNAFRAGIATQIEFESYEGRVR